MPVSIPTIRLRSPVPPFVELGELRPVNESLNYSRMLLQPGEASFSIADYDPNPPQLFGLGAVVSIERPDGLFPWFGYVPHDELAHGEGSIPVIATDFVGAVLSRARTAKVWREIDRAAGELISVVVGDAMARAQPPLDLRWDDALGGPHVAYTARAEPISDFLATLAQTGWEWWTEADISGGGVIVWLRWSQRRGRDWRNFVVFEEGQDFVDAKLTREAGGFLAAGIAIGGTGDLGQRTAFEVSGSGTSSNGVAAEQLPSAGLAVLPGLSPALLGTRVQLAPAVTNSDALRAMGSQLHSALDNIGLQLSFRLAEATVSIEKLRALEVGGLYGVHFSNLALQLGYDANFRAIGLRFGDMGVIDVEGQVIGDGWQ